MSNGSAALRLVEPKSPPATAPDELEIGCAVASAACLLYRSVLDYAETGCVPPLLKAEGGMRIAKIAMLQLESFDEPAFIATAHREGHRQLRKILDAEPDFRRKHGANAGDAILNEIVDDVLGVVGRVVATEKLIRMH
jgi:hypothetical protein